MLAPVFPQFGKSLCQNIAVFLAGARKVYDLNTTALKSCDITWAGVHHDGVSHTPCLAQAAGYQVPDLTEVRIVQV